MLLEIYGGKGTWCNSLEESNDGKEKHSEHILHHSKFGVGLNPRDPIPQIGSEHVGVLRPDLGEESVVPAGS